MALCEPHVSFYIIDIDECTQGGHDCHGNAACSNTNGSFVCRCLSGYIGDGIIECQGTELAWCELIVVEYVPSHRIMYK